jgi:hypothetical protein
LSLVKARSSFGVDPFVDPLFVGSLIYYSILLLHLINRVVI